MNEEPIPSVTTAVASSLSTKINRQLTIENGIVVHYAFNGPGGYAAYTWKPMAEFGQFVFTLHNGNVVQEMRYFIDPRTPKPLPRSLSGIGKGQCSVNQKQRNVSRLGSILAAILIATFAIATAKRALPILAGLAFIAYVLMMST